MESESVKPTLGGIYRTRDGANVAIIKRYPGHVFDEPFPFVGTNGLEYDHCGRADISVDRHRTDLVQTVAVPFARIGTRC